ncbi:hypothetical protein AB3S75_034285 [Citrus x aurantiifolia]
MIISYHVAHFHPSNDIDLGFAYGFYTSQVLELLKVSIQKNTCIALTTTFLIEDDEARSCVVTCWVYL